MLEVKINSSGFDSDEVVLQGLNFTVDKGEVLMVVGKSGIGKTTLLKSIAGMIPFLDGEIKLDGRRIKKAKESLIAGDGEIALVNQEFNEDLYFTVEENIKAALLHLTNDDRKDFTHELIDVMSLNTVRNKKTRFLSGGEKQRVSLACALAKEPKVLLLDEPFAHIDIYLRGKIGNYLKRLVKENKVSLVWVSHDGEEALSWADSIFIATNNDWLGKFTPEEVYFELKDKPFAHYFGDVNTIVFNEENYFFRPWEFNLTCVKGKKKVAVAFLSSSLKSGYYANYFKTANNVEIVLFSFHILNDCKEIYV